MKLYPVRLRVLTLSFFLLAAATLQAADPVYHELKKGDTLFSIARKFDIPYEALAAANGIVDPTKLRIGSKLIIPELVFVEPGDSISGIARKFGINSEDIRKANKLGMNAIIQPGDILIVPASRPGTTKVSPASSPSTGTVSNSPRPGTTTTTIAPSSKPAPTVTTTIKSATTTTTTTIRPIVTTTTVGSRLSTTIPAPFPPTSTSVTLPVEVPALKTMDRPVDRKISWPCAGEYLYLDGKLEGVMARTLPGETARAVAGGLVVSAGPARGFGLVAFVQSPSGFVYVYGGNEKLSVSIGDSVKSGQEIGSIGIDPRDGGPVAYFIVFRDGNSIDPARAPRD